ncbi:MAG TPA: hypothetical protein VFQ73_05700 [Flavisolibacter sp.]|nr:hypothetical protein [Flavisolibacter sp.]
MKTLISYVALTVFVLASSFTIDVQENLNHKATTYNCFSYFKAHRQGKAGVGMNWSVASTDIVEFVIERSYDEEYFETAGTVGFNGATSYKFTDNDVYPGYITYRITAVKADGTTECSPVEKIRIVQRR